jgi:hypothetical protein
MTSANMFREYYYWEQKYYSNYLCTLIVVTQFGFFLYYITPNLAVGWYSPKIIIVFWEQHYQKWGSILQKVIENIMLQQHIFFE